jgi:hypothetical protein
MFIYPFKIVYLQSGQTRQMLHDQLLNHTFLSDQGFRKPDNNPRAFFGELSNQDFTLETIEKGDRLYSRNNYRSNASIINYVDAD